MNTDYTEQTHSNNISTKTSPSQNRDQYFNNVEWLQLLDPVVLDLIKDPNMVNVQNKILTVVFWDISGLAQESSLKSYPVELEEDTGDILVNSNGIDDDDDKTKK
jgi:hypothetical protein